MKKLLVLGGGSPRNRAWGEACIQYFKDRFDSAYFMQYDHWVSGEPNLNFQTELNKYEEVVRNSNEQDEWFVYAKSVGSILTLKAVAAGLFTPSHCVFFGMPFSVFNDTVVKDEFLIIESFSVPTLAFHNDNDPTALYELTKKIIDEVMPTVTLKTLQGDTHDYLDFSQYVEDIDAFTATRL